MLRGRFTGNAGSDLGAPHPESAAASPQPGPEPGPEPEWCERRLLARIHRYTLTRLRREIDPVEPADYMRFLFAWHGLDERREGPAGLLAVIEQLEGFEAPAAAWEDSILAARLRGYDPSWLDTLWPHRPGGVAPAHRSVRPAHGHHDRDPGRVHRPPATSRPGGRPERTGIRKRSARCRRGRGGSGSLLRTGGAQFFDDLKVQSGLLATQVEDGLAELVAGGHVTADGYAGLRALVRRHRRTGPRRRMDPFGDAGRWCLIDSRLPPEHATPRRAPRPDRRRAAPALRGRVPKGAGARGGLPPWRELVRVLRRREDRGEVRGGRFVNRFSGEQFALPEAVGELRRIRRAAPGGRILALSAADPLNLTGIVTPGERVSSTAAREVAYRDGEPDGGALRAAPRRRHRRGPYRA